LTLLTLEEPFKLHCTALALLEPTLTGVPAAGAETVICGRMEKAAAEVPLTLELS